MGKIIQDIWIVNNQGAVMFQRLFDRNIDSNLLGGFISALNTFAMQFDDNGLTDFEMNNKQFIIAKKQDLIFITDCAKKVNQMEAQKELLKIMHKFMEEYPPEVYQKCEENPRECDKFLLKIDDSLQKIMDRLNQALWKP